MDLDDATRANIEQLIRGDDVVLFMKGTRHMPQCGFSAAVVRILDELLPSYRTVDVLADPRLRDGLKVFSTWPTIPQLYIRGDFVGGCDIVQQLHAAGDLAKTLGVGPPAPPAVRVSEAAVRAFKDAAEGDDLIRVEVGPRFEYGLCFGPRADGDVEVAAQGLTFVFDAASARRISALSIDYVQGPDGAGFKLASPEEPPREPDVRRALT